MKYGMVMVALGYLLVIGMFGWWGVAAAGLHVGSLFLMGPRR